MKKYKLKNGLTIIKEKTNSNSLTIQLTVKVGSNDEKEGVRGISHFIEHMLFEGTKNRKDAKEISNEIESIGGELNAFTDNVRTGYYIKVPSKHFEKALSIISDMLCNPLFREKDIDKERQVILKEINIFNDESRYYQWILFQKNLFKKHPSHFPAYGTVKNVKKITRKDIIDYFNKYYTANNSILSIVGNIKESKLLINRYFKDMKKGKSLTKKKKIIEPKIKRPKIVKVKRDIKNSYMVLGYKSVPRDHKDFYCLEVIRAILGKGQSGRIFNEIRNKRGLAYEVGVYHKSSLDYGFFSVYLGAEKKNISLAKDLILKEFENLKDLSKKEIKEAIGFVEGRYILDSEDTHDKADSLAFWEIIKDASLEKEYIKKIKKVTKKDILRTAKKYLTKDYLMVVIEER